jgi:hypothetical protein
LRPSLAALSAIAALAFQANALAVTQTTGAGSAVAVIQGTAEFESLNALVDNPYLEGGMAFSRGGGLSFNNNGCGFAGCGNHPGFAGFSGNYMYGFAPAGPGAFFDMVATGGTVFHGLEFIVGTGFLVTSQNVTWEAFNSSIMVGSGSLSLAPGSIIGFSDAVGFDTLRYTNFEIGLAAPAFDSVHAQFTITAVPEPQTYALMLAGLGLLGFAARRRQIQGEQRQ